jgi:hypothetical protein
MLQMFGVFCSVTLLVEAGVSIASLASVVITGLVTTVSILLFRVFAYAGSVACRPHVEQVKARTIPYPAVITANSETQFG